jgi:hypothetical protein
MAAAVLTPRVRVLVVCDRVRPRDEADAFDLKGVRYQIRADSFPFAPRRLGLFLLLSSLRRGRFPGYVKVVEDRTDRAIFYGQIEPAPTFDGANPFLPVYLPVRCRFPSAGPYTFQVWFFRPDSR